MHLIRHHGNLVPLGRLTALKLILEKSENLKPESREISGRKGESGAEVALEKISKLRFSSSEEVLK